MMRRLQRMLMVCLLASLLLVTSCAKAPSQFDQAQKESTAKGASAVVKDSTTGGTFNQFFPPSGGGYDRVFVQEKKGFAEAKLKKGGTELAVMSISDTLNNPTATAKFKSSQAQIKGYPSVQQGTTGTALLINDRYQVKVLSRDPAFTEKDRQTWLQKFDLAGLAKLQAKGETNTITAKKAPSFIPSPKEPDELTAKKQPAWIFAN
ncbi:hypothetical protein [Chroococcus sp. FPU101]|uniref:hypothetical protein n=1 Tax=Chroococcus sp. FPU101 TaxID=1974212 RepID=UPI001AA35B9F|nr:hypothetical protein CFPU101_06130 [Chroococcus sp. FPU101]